MKSTIRLDKMLGNLGYGTRSEIKKFVKQGEITVNGQPAKDASMQIRADQDEVYLGEELISYREFIYLLLHKPAGVVSATEDNRDRTVLDLLEQSYVARSPFPVGRLDKDTEGLLLLSNDGKLAHELLSPRKHVPKTYRAVVNGQVGELEEAAFREGVELDDGYRTLPATLSVLNDDAGLSEALSRISDAAEHERAGLSWIELTIHEGKFHQVKRMFEAVGKKVLYLRRVSMGPLVLDPKLAPGQWRELTDEEITSLREYRKGGTT